MMITCGMLSVAVLGLLGTRLVPRKGLINYACDA